MKLILEGPDNAGKTTLARKLSNNGLVAYKHPGGRPDDLKAEINCMIEQYNHLLHHQHIILDRITAISQQVYNPDKMHEVTREIALDSLLNLQPVVIYCRPSDDRLLRVQDLKWREGESDEHKEKIIRGQHTFVQRYDALMQTIPCITYDYDDTAHADIIVTKAIKAFTGSTADLQWFYDLMHLRG